MAANGRDLGLCFLQSQSHIFSQLVKKKNPLNSEMALCGTSLSNPYGGEIIRSYSSQCVSGQVTSARQVTSSGIKGESLGARPQF